MLNRQKDGSKGIKLTCYVTDKKIGSEKKRVGRGTQDIFAC